MAVPAQSARLTWYVWSALGLYPEIPGTADLAIGSPLFPRRSSRSAAAPSLLPRRTLLTAASMSTAHRQRHLLIAGLPARRRRGLRRHPGLRPRRYPGHVLGIGPGRRPAVLQRNSRGLSSTLDIVCRSFARTKLQIGTSTGQYSDNDVREWLVLLEGLRRGRADGAALVCGLTGASLRTSG